MKSTSIHTVYKNNFPICFLSDLSVLLYKRGSFSVLDLSFGKICSLISLNLRLKDSVLSRIPLFDRVFRKGVRCGAKISEDIILFAMGHTIYELNIKKPIISGGFKTSDGSRPLIFTRIAGINGFKDGMYFGAYKGNPERAPISIYMRTGPDIWEVVFEFPSGTIEHIHNIIPDPYKNIVYILTGDFDGSAGIWKAENGFKSVVPLLTGNQIYRGCVGFSTPEGLLYATDSPFIKNSIRLLKWKDENWESTHLADINGPSIYGCKWMDDFVFSTSVEGDGRNQSIWYKILGRTRGDGIIEDCTVIYKGNIEDGFKKIYSIKKDILPFFLFQFGNIIFPSEMNGSHYLPAYPVATRHNSMNTILLR